MLEKATPWAPRIIAAVVIVGGFFILAMIIKRIITKAAERLEVDKNLSSLLARTTNITLVIFGFVTALGTLGVNVAALVAGLGLTGFALGFALKDTISNLLSGVLMLLYRPFEIGSRIKIAGYEGIVILIDLRYTKLDSQGNKVLIPSSKLFTDPITVVK